MFRLWLGVAILLRQCGSSRVVSLRRKMTKESCVEFLAHVWFSSLIGSFLTAEGVAAPRRFFVSILTLPSHLSSYPACAGLGPSRQGGLSTPLVLLMG